MHKSITGLLVLALLVGAFTPVFADDELPFDQGMEETPVDTILPLDEATSTDPVIETSLPAATTTEEVASTSVEITVAEETESTQLIVKFKESDIDLDHSSGRREADAVLAEADAVLESRLIEANSAVVSVTDAASAIKELEKDASVEYAEENYARTIGAVIPTDPDFATYQWALNNTGQTLNAVGTVGADIDATLAWDLSLGTSTIVAVIDTGVLYTHPDLVNNMWNGSACVSDTGTPLGNCVHGYDFHYGGVTGDLDPTPTATSSAIGYHGTHVAGIIAAEMNNATGTVGVAPNAKIMALKFGLDVASEVRAIDFAIQNGATIINASYGGNTFSTPEYEAIQRFKDAGGIFIAAAGNDGTDNDSVPEYPASYNLSNIVSVAATDNVDALATFSSPTGSNYGATTVDLGAPGRAIYSTIATNGTAAAYGSLNGTSMAAPHVSGVAALLKSLYPAASTTPTALKSALLDSGDALPALSGKTVSGKRLNAYGALQYLEEDLIAPIITLIGSASVSLTTGGTYNDQGATATDNIDESVTVTATSTVNTGLAGTYTVTYTASDIARNAATPIVRTVIVSDAPVQESSRRRSGGGGGGGGSRNKDAEVVNPTRNILTTTATGPYAQMTPEQRTQLLTLLLTLLQELQAKLAVLQAQGL